MAPGTALIQQGAGDGDVFVVARGQASVLKDDVEVDRVGPGQLIGERAALYGLPQPATVVATDDLVAIRIPRPAHLAAQASSAEAQVLAHQVAPSYGRVHKRQGTFFSRG